MQGLDPNNLSIECDPVLRPRIMRKLGFLLPWDACIDAMAPPKGSSLATLAIRLCRLYRAVRPRSIGDRCAFEPSCSRYAEMVYRTQPFLLASRLTYRRLRRCNASNGGLDLPPDINQHLLEGERSGAV
ncbi:MAG: membrane protein insertion efficiency factor YidD [Rhodobacter sp.]|nr:membrane protein insertion efficiency factor YidD [Rhodobacter sp.]